MSILENDRCLVQPRAIQYCREQMNATREAYLYVKARLAKCYEDKRLSPNDNEVQYVANKNIGYFLNECKRFKKQLVREVCLLESMMAIRAKYEAAQAVRELS